MIKIRREKEKELKKFTSKRRSRMEQEFKKDPEVTVFDNVHRYDQIVGQVGIPFAAVCEHHEVGFEGQVNIAYIPAETVVGLSKLARIAEKFLNPTVKTTQEKATHLITHAIEELLRPRGVMVVVKAKHGCISHRGVKKPSTTITSSVRGAFAYDPGARGEFLQLVNSNHGN